ncbi:type IV pili methyl-accepting chemotaxis transducer N-terminal domain-containing protein [Marivita hallyeonensis]|uniref:Type IV pili methyl-accepting chemotaxis transducer N-term n=1 Tax=Marivita hallyeonensis TaxID=996342 RepID=A0A1M5LTD4_9RHOB|nr:type IV pili methyl-accepting chemotaxis transducer N-terminal domain-containing protein [Marivita hallyeonensis]SHG67623.1 Type IV pili methyl-accepting chemotaxis transducer N-term [Marivita hallyeonensis]
MSLAAEKSPSFDLSKVVKNKLTAVTFVGALFSTAEVRASDNTEGSAEIILAQLVDDIGAAERVEAADELRIVSQEASSAACYLFSGIEPEESRRLVIESRDIFERNLDALLNGNPSMNIIGAETRRKTIAELESLRAIWTPVSEALAALLEDANDADAVGVVKANSKLLYEKTNYLVSVISGEYSNPAELLQVDALMLDIVGRQGMYTQKIAKNACKVWNGEEVETSTQELTGAIEIFETSLNALLHGMPEAGLKAAPTPEIIDGLSGVISDWAETRTLVDTLLASGALAGDEQTALFNRMNDKMYQLKKITHDYALYSKHKYD